MKTRFVVFLLALLCASAVATSAGADDDPAYFVAERCSGAIGPRCALSVERDVADFKRQMAALLYPVNLRSSLPPNRDEEFKKLIEILQHQMGQKPTGVPTTGQAKRLRTAARDLWADPVVLGVKNVIVHTDWASAEGAEYDDGAPAVANWTKILCKRETQGCIVTGASYLPDSLWLYDTYEYVVTAWTRQRITASLEHPCGTATLTIDADTANVTFVSIPRGGKKDGCAGNEIAFKDGKPQTWKLVDGIKFGMDKWTRDRQAALQLVYPSARRLFVN
jgi:hypothetical protein